MSDPAESNLFKPAPRKGLARRWRIPLALRDDPSAPATFDGADILGELPDDGGMLLWQIFRDVLLWAGECSAAGSAELFAPEARTRRQAAIDASALEEPVRDAVREIVAVLHSDGAHPASVHTLTTRCRDLAVWAAARHSGATAIAFARASAAPREDDAAPALFVGQLAARFRRRTMARTWFRRAVALARQQGDWRTYAIASVELGRAALAAGKTEEARALFQLAARVGKRNGLRVARGLAHHGHGLAYEAEGCLDNAEKHLKVALRLLGKVEHPRVPAIRHDLAGLLLCRGDGEASSAALRILSALLPHRTQPGERIATLFMMIRAAAGATQAEPDELRNFWFEAVALLDELGETPEAGRLLLELARITAGALDGRRADELARRAQRIGAREPALAEDAASFLARSRADDRAPS